MTQLGLTGRTSWDKYLFQSEILRMKAWHAMCFRENLTEVSGYRKVTMWTLLMFFTMETQPCDVNSVYANKKKRKGVQ